MAEETPGNSDRIRGAQSPAGASKRRFRVMKILVWVAFLVVAVSGVYKSGLLDSVVRPVQSSIPSITNIPVIGSIFSKQGDSTDSTRVMGSVFSSDASEDLFSEVAVLRSVGQSPDEPSRVLFRAFRTPEFRQPEEQQKAEPPAKPGASAAETAQSAAGTQATGSPPLKLVSAPKSAPKQAPTPVITTRGPSEEVPAKGESAERTVVGDQPALPKPEKRKPEPAAEGVTAPQAGKQDKETVGQGEPKTTTTDTLEEDSLSRKSNSPESKGEQQEYQIPGSLRVSIKNYKGSKVRWDLMVILDDSASMGRKGKAWPSGRMSAARRFVEKMAGSLSPGSRIAVRDFYCSKSRSKKKRRSRPCLSHMLQDWAEIPIVGLKESLLQTKPVGRTNPCAAAAYSLKKDFSPKGALHPRIVVITAAATKCRSGDVLKVINRRWGDDRPNVDVIGIGMSRRRQVGYRTLAKKTKGVFLKVDKPSDIDAAVSRYKKALDGRIREKVEVRGPKTAVTVAPGEEITLAPGSYTVVLPVLKGLNPDRREIKNVKIRSGKSNVLNVRVRKGRALVRFTKK